MKYCPYCGAKIKADAARCPVCKETIRSAQQANPLAKISCALAYFGTLFWMPLVFCPNDRNAKSCANQGLWSLLTAFFAFFFMRIVKTIGLLLIKTPLSFLVNPLLAFSTMLFLFLMLYLVVMSLKNAMAVRNGSTPQPMLFFNSRPIIR